MPALNAAADAADAGMVRALLEGSVNPSIITAGEGVVRYADYESLTADIANISKQRPQVEPQGENGSRGRTALHSALAPDNIAHDFENDKSAEKLECVNALLAAHGIDVNLASTAGHTGERTGSCTLRLTWATWAACVLCWRRPVST